MRALPIKSPKDWITPTGTPAARKATSKAELFTKLTTTPKGPSPSPALPNGARMSATTLVTWLSVVLTAFPKTAVIVSPIEKNGTGDAAA